jgi:hypothetical protein
MTASASRRRHRVAVPAIMLTGGAALTAATAAGSAPAVDVAALASVTVLLTAAFWWVARGSGDVAAVAASRPDERQRAIDLGATALAGLAVAVFCLGAAIVSLARGGNGYPWAGLDAIFGLAYAAAFAVLRRH